MFISVCIPYMYACKYVCMYARTYVCDSVLEIRIKNWLAIFKYVIFYRLLNYCLTEKVWEIWPIKIDFGRPNAEIGKKMADCYF